MTTRIIPAALNVKPGGIRARIKETGTTGIGLGSHGGGTLSVNQQGVLPDTPYPAIPRYLIILTMITQGVVYPARVFISTIDTGDEILCR